MIIGLVPPAIVVTAFLSFGNIIELSSEGGTGQHFSDLPGVVPPTFNRPS